MIKGKISEIFESIQGEGIYVGEKQIFVRFFGCNLNCKYCDTKLRWFFEYDPQELLDEIQEFGNEYHSVSFTGGEPLLQKDFLKEALKLTKAKGYKNYLETNGTLADELAEVIDYVDIVAMDLKLPSSTGLADFWQAHKKFIDIAFKKEVFLKAVICNSTTEDDLKSALKFIKETNKTPLLILQPNTFDEGDKLKSRIENFKQMCARENITACAISQMHKVIGLK